MPLNSNTYHTPPLPRQHTPRPHPHHHYHPPPNAHSTPSPLRWLIIGTSPDLWNLQYIYINIVQISPIQIPEHLTHGNLLQSPSLPRGLPFSPTNHQHQDSINDTTNTPSPTLAPRILHHASLYPPHILATAPHPLAPKGNTHNRPPRTIPPKQLP